MQAKIGSQHQVFAHSLKPQILLLLLVTGFMPLRAWPAAESGLWEPAMWTFRNPSCSGNPFDLSAKAIFTHAPIGRKIRTELFYDRGESWKLRFTGTHSGRWSFTTESTDPELDGLKGRIEVRPNPGVPGFITNYGSKWGRLGTNSAFVPQYVMYCDIPSFRRNPDRIDADIRNFFVEHGFNGFHIAVVCRWFDFDKLRSNEIDSASPNPDPRTFETIELRSGKCLGQPVESSPGRYVASISQQRPDTDLVALAGRSQSGPLIPVGQKDRTY